MHGSCAGAQRHHPLILADKGLKIFFKSVHIGTKRDNPIGIKGFLDESLFFAAHVSQAKVNQFAF